SPVLTQTVIKSEPVAPQAVVPEIPLDGNYVVQAGDSLWKVASKFRAATGMSVQQTMDILYQQNPQAFVRGDKNLLKLGARLSVPAGLSEQPAAPPLEQIASDSYQQNQSTVTFSEETAPSTVAVVPVSAPVVEMEVNEVEQLKAQLAELRAERKELIAFQQQVHSEMQKLQAQRSAMIETIALAEEVSQEIKQENQVAAIESDTAPPPTLKQIAGQSQVQPAEQRGAVAQDLIGTSNHSPDTLIEKSGSGFWYLLAMLPLGLLIVFMGMRARKVEEIKRTEEIRDEDLYELVFGTKRDRSKADSPDQVKKAMHQIKEKAIHQEAVVIATGAEEEEASRDDVDQMIELYMLYNQFQKALSVIQTEIAKRPGRKDLRLRLMQVYAKTQDWDAFEEQMEVLQRLGDEDILKAAAQLRGDFEYDTLHRDAG
ncbi:MAG: LysM peptidoglycan-binding domain-containing protein, partial [Pseudohongiella nitratireducens]